MLLLAALLAVTVGGCSVATSSSNSAVDVPSTSVAISTTPPVPRDAVRVSIIGDSYTSGSIVGGNGPANWTEVARQLLAAGGDPVDLSVQGLSGSGYVRLGGTGMTFTDAIPGAVTDQTQLVVVFGSINDGSSAPAAVASSAELALQRIDQAAPQALVVIIGPQWIDADPPANLLAIRDALATTIGAHPRVSFVDPLAEGWFAGQWATLIGSDGLHPTDAGHRHLAELITPRIAAAIDSISGGS